MKPVAPRGEHQFVVTTALALYIQPTKVINSRNRVINTSTSWDKYIWYDAWMNHKKKKRKVHKQVVIGESAYSIVRREAYRSHTSMTRLLEDLIATLKKWTATASNAARKPCKPKSPTKIAGYANSMDGFAHIAAK